jgi:hypothetical protein
VETLKYVACFLLLLCLWVCLYNLKCFILAVRAKRREAPSLPSPIPIISVLLVCFASIAYQDEPKWWIWLFVGLDITNWQVLFFLILTTWKRLARAKSPEA